MNTTPAALLVIDMQRGAFNGERITPIDEADALVGNVGLLIAAARSGGVPAVFVQHCEEQPGEAFETGTPHWEFHEQLMPAPGEPVVQKHASSAFDGTDLSATLARLGAQHLVVCGLQSEFCVSNTSKAALALGLRVSVAQDGHSTWASGGLTADAIRAQANDALRGLGARLASSAELAAELAAELHAAAAPRSSR